MPTLQAFKDYLTSTHMTFSYKAVTVLVLLDGVDTHGRISRENLIRRFHAFYLQRQQQGLTSEKERERHPSPLLKPAEVNEAQVWQILARYPLPLMEDFILLTDDVVQIKPSLWEQMRASDMVELKEIALQRIEAYYEEV